MGGRTFKCSTSHYICSQVSKFRYPWTNMTVGCFNAPAPHIPSWTNADTFYFVYNVFVLYATTCPEINLYYYVYRVSHQSSYLGFIQFVRE